MKGVDGRLAFRRPNGIREPGPKDPFPRLLQRNVARTCPNTYHDPVRVYLNTSALNRPFDDLSSQRVRLEAEAVTVVVAEFEGGQIELVSSEYLEFEVAQIPDPERAQRVRTILGASALRIEMSTEVIERARDLERVGLRGLDALHIAAAEAAMAQLLITTDDRMLRRSRRLGTDLAIRVVLPTVATALLSDNETSQGNDE